MNKNPELSERLMSLIQTTAMLALEKDPLEREAYLSTKQAEYLTDALSTGAKEAVAREMAEKMDEFVRAMIGIIERGGPRLTSPNP